MTILKCSPRSEPDDQFGVVACGTAAGLWYSPAPTPCAAARLAPRRGG